MVSEGNTSAKRKPWYWVGGGLVVAAFLGAFGTQAAGWISDLVRGWFDTPFHANLSEYTDECETFIIDESLLEEVPIDADGNIDETWVVEHGGLQAPPRLLQLSLVGDQDATIVINSISLEEVTHYPAPDAPVTVMECPPQGGELAGHSITLNYQTNVAEIATSDGNPVPAMTIGGGEAPVVFSFRPPDGEDATSSCFCTWRMKISWTGASRNGTETVDLAGDPVSLVTIDPSWPIYAFDDGRLQKY